MSSSAAFVIFLFASLVLLYLVSQFSSVNFSKLKISDEPNIKNKDVSITALFLLLISCVISICLSTYNFTDFSVDYDSMSVQLNFLIKDEIKFQMWNGRFFPLSHVDNAVILKVFESFSALKVYLILHFIFLMTLAYFAFDFIPKNRRLVLLSLLAISPPIVNIYSSAIYSERNILLFLVASTLFLRLGIKEVLNAKLALLISVTLFFISLYFKETTILYLISFLGLIFILRNFEALKALNYKCILDFVKKPLAYVEVIFLIPCLLWLLSFFLLGGELNPEYVAKRDNSLTEYVVENFIELALISTIALFMSVRARFDLYAILILSCIPMVLYCLFVSQSMGAYNTFTYYNYLIYMVFSICIVCTKTSKFVIIAPLTYTTFALITISGFLEFTKEVNKRNKVVEHAVEIIKNETLNISLGEPWKERNLARFILYKAGQGNINHLTKHDLFCKDTSLYNANTSCAISEQPPSCWTLIDANTSVGQREMLMIIVNDSEKCRRKR